jgi:hypothetical protein
MGSLFFRPCFVDILQILLSRRRFSGITPLRRSIGYRQMRYRQDAKDAKLREEEKELILASRHFASFAPSR